MKHIPIILSVLLLLLPCISFAAAQRSPEEIWKSLEKLPPAEREKKLVEGAKNEPEMDRAQRCAENLGRAASTQVEGRNSFRRVIIRRGHGFIRRVGSGKGRKLFFASQPATAVDPRRPRHNDSNDDGG